MESKLSPTPILQVTKKKAQRAEGGENDNEDEDGERKQQTKVTIKKEGETRVTQSVTRGGDRQGKGQETSKRGE